MAQRAPSADVWLPPAVTGAAFLRDGTEVWVRPVQPSDRDLVLDLLERESPESLDPRYFAALRRGLAEGEFVAPPPGEGLCLLVLGDRSARVAVLGLGEYVRTRPSSPVADVAFLVAGPFRGRGIATLLLARLARAARGFGILRFEARVREETPELLEVFRGSGLPFTEAPGEGEVDVVIPLSPDLGASGAAASEAAGRTRLEGSSSITYGSGRRSTAGRRSPATLSRS